MLCALFNWRVSPNKEQAMNHPTPILTDDKLDSVCGGVDNYVYCADGPAGRGLYPNDCSNPFIQAIVQGAIKGASGGSPK